MIVAMRAEPDGIVGAFSGPRYHARQIARAPSPCPRLATKMGSSPTSRRARSRAYHSMERILQWADSFSTGE